MDFFVSENQLLIIKLILNLQNICYLQFTL